MVSPANIPTVHEPAGVKMKKCFSSDGAKAIPCSRSIMCWCFASRVLWPRTDIAYLLVFMMLIDVAAKLEVCGKRVDVGLADAP